MANDPLPPLALTGPQRDALMELGARGAGGQFDQLALAQLFVLGLIEVRTEDRRVALTGRGRIVYDPLIPPG